MPFSDEIEKPIGHMNNWDLFFLLVLGIGAMVGTFYFTDLAFTVGGLLANWLAAGSFLVAPYCYAAGNKETYFPPIGFYLKCLFWWVVLLIFAVVFALGFLAIFP